MNRRAFLRATSLALPALSLAPAPVEYPPIHVSLIWVGGGPFLHGVEDGELRIRATLIDPHNFTFCGLLSVPATVTSIQDALIYCDDRARVDIEHKIRMVTPPGRRTEIVEDTATTDMLVKLIQASLRISHRPAYA